MGTSRDMYWLDGVGVAGVQGSRGRSSGVFKEHIEGLTRVFRGGSPVLGGL